MFSAILKYMMSTIYIWSTFKKVATILKKNMILISLFLLFRITKKIYYIHRIYYSLWDFRLSGGGGVVVS